MGVLAYGRFNFIFKWWFRRNCDFKNSRKSCCFCLDKLLQIFQNVPFLENYEWIPLKSTMSVRSFYLFKNAKIFRETINSNQTKMRNDVMYLWVCVVGKTVGHESERERYKRD